ncbi:MAG: phage/plasmid primase, P4 family [Ruminococcus sp.]|nr:phage/plasmid primase, P4 family [Ruminococcus sp.]
MKYILVRDNGKEGVRVYVYEQGVYVYYASDMFKAVIKNIIAEYDEDVVSMGAVHETYAILTTDLDYISESALNAREDIINFQNGLLVVTATDVHLIPHTPDILTTIQIPCNYTEELIPTPNFDRYLHTLTNGDRDVQQLLLEFMGVVLSNIKGYRMKKSLFLVGAGDTGKSMLKSLTERLIGKGNFIGIDLKEIEARFGTGAIYGTRLAGSSDMSFLSVDELKTFKKITGGDSLFAEFKGQQAFEFTYDGLLWFCMNRLPKFGGDDGKWVYDRIMVVECKNVIPTEKQDKQLLDKLYAEREGIVRKAILAMQRVIHNGYRFSEPKSVTTAREQYMSDNNTVISFWNECMVQRNKISDKATVGKIYDVYKAWCQDNNSGYAKSAKEFRNIISEYLNTSYSNLTVRSKAGIIYRNYTLSVDTKQQYCRIYGFDDVLW